MRRILLIALSVTMLSVGCTLTATAHYRVDAAPWGAVHAHIFRRPSYQLAFVHRQLCSSNPECTVQWLDVAIDPPWFARFIWNGAKARTAELREAIDRVELSGWRRCVVLYSVWSTGWTVSDPPQCELGEFVRL